MSSNPYKFQMAIRDFHDARQRAAIQEVLDRLRGRPTQLLSYEEVAEKLNLHVRTERGTQDIPLDAIVGSVGRYTEFTRSFLPRREGDLERWASVKAAMDEGLGLPPIEVYKVGEAYFVIDGNHRVSIARQEGFKYIEARVIEFRTSIPLTPDISHEDLIVKAEYASFLDATRIMDARPNVDLNVTACCQYDKLMDQIRLCQYLLQEEQKKDVSLQEAAANWYDTIYIPLAEAIRDRGLLRWFPDRTITDLYIWISENRSALEKELGWEIQSDIAATGLILERSASSEPGSWRKARIATRYTDHLFQDILVPLSGVEASWFSVEQAILIARREHARLHGLHIVDAKGKLQSPNALAVQAKFQQLCLEANVEGKLAIEAGEITGKIRERASLMDLIVLMIEHPPLGGLSSLASPFRTIMVNCSLPLLGIPRQVTQFQRALLAYDGSPSAREALFVATYLAEMWKTELLVFTTLDGSRVKKDVQDHVRRYLEFHEVNAEYLISERGAMDHLKNTLEECKVDLLLMGTYGVSLLRQVIGGSALDYMLRETPVPLFVCH